MSTADVLMIIAERVYYALDKNGETQAFAFGYLESILTGFGILVFTG